MSDYFKTLKEEDLSAEEIKKRASWFSERAFVQMNLKINEIICQTVEAPTVSQIVG
jgi:tRNA/tmRNA/rRNA uracil-C5-methylase (TrmA/RlmC/RlmD family)